MSPIGRCRRGVSKQDDGGAPPRRLRWLGRRIRHALARGEFELYLQPQVSLAGGAVDAVEALVRWHCPGHGLVFPAAFIDPIQRGRFARAFDAWALRAAIAEAAALRAAGHDLRVAVNLAPASIENGRLARDVEALLDDAGVPPALLEIEVTEQVLEVERAAEKTVAQLSALGVQTALDDFGVGFSSLTRIAGLPFGTLKVDRRLLARSVDSTRAATVFAAAVRLAHDLGLSVVAEGVETPSAWRQCEELGADRAQGWLIAPALRRAQLLELLERGWDAGRAYGARPLVSAA
jgi:EAL domain-containing protein (putative c-di-GMP-specific phosphodiesterase class I)